MGRVVLDASALVEYVLVERRYAAAAARIESPAVSLHTPSLCDVEFVQALRRGLLHGALSSERAAEALANYLALPLTRHGHLLLLGRTLQLRASFSAYDASYVALAERLEAPLVTADGRLARAARHNTDVEVIEV